MSGVDPHRQGAAYTCHRTGMLGLNPRGGLPALLSWALKKVGKTFTKTFPWRRGKSEKPPGEALHRHLMMLMALINTELSFK